MFQSSWSRCGWLLVLTCLGGGVPAAQAQNLDQNLRQSEEQFIRRFQPVPIPQVPAVPVQPVTRPRNLPTSQYVIQMDRIPEIAAGKNLRGRIASFGMDFPRPQRWDITAVKGIIRFNHSPALLPSSTLTIEVNGQGVANTKLTAQNVSNGQLEFSVPLEYLKPYNNIRILVNQRFSLECEDPFDPVLWTQVLPDSRLWFEYSPKALTLDFSQFPVPFFDSLDLLPVQLSYVLPSAVDSQWLTSVAQLHGFFGRLADFRLVQSQTLDQIQSARTPTIIIGTPSQQPALQQLASQVPFKLQNGQWLDGEGQPIDNETALLALATVNNSEQPALIVTGNSAAAIAKGIQFIVQTPTESIGTGRSILVSNLEQVPQAPLRDWPRFIPPRQDFSLADLGFRDTTIRGVFAGPLELDLRSLPDDQPAPNASMTLNYSYGAQSAANISTIEVMIDNTAIASFGLTDPDGDTRVSKTFEIPGQAITPSSKLQVFFRLYPNQFDRCKITAAEQLWGTLHSDTKFNFPRQTVIKLPDLKAFRTGYPFTIRQDLSETAMVLPDQPSSAVLNTFLSMIERLGRLTKAQSVRLEAYTRSQLTDEVRKNRHLIGIGVQGNTMGYPLPETLLQPSGFGLGPLLARLRGETAIQTFTDEQGVLGQVLSPWNSERVVLNIMAQRDKNLAKVDEFIAADNSFYQMVGDTTLINSATDFYFLDLLPSKTQSDASVPAELLLFLRENWIFLPIGLVLIALVLFGFTQVYVRTVSRRRS